MGSSLYLYVLKFSSIPLSLCFLPALGDANNFDGAGMIRKLRHELDYYNCVSCVDSIEHLTYARLVGNTYDQLICLSLTSQ